MAPSGQEYEKRPPGGRPRKWQEEARAWPESAANALGERERLIRPDASREEVLWEVVEALSAACRGVRPLVVIAEVQGHLRALGLDSAGSQASVSLSDPALRTVLAGLVEAGGGTLDGVATRCLAALLGLAGEGLGSFWLGPLRVDSRFNGLLGLGLPKSMAPELDFSTAAAGLIAPVEAFIGHASLREEAYVAGGLRERALLGLDIHDSVLQDLSYVRLQLGRLKMVLPPSDERALAIVGDLTGAIRRAAAEMRQLSLALTRSESWPSLVAAVEEIVGSFRSRFDMEVSLTVRGQTWDLGPRITSQTVRILQEALSNIWRHAGANRVLVDLAYEEKVLELAVTDDGCGFDPEDQESGRLGLKGMKRRVCDLGGDLAVESAPGRGTTIRATIPARRH
ncbi:MAG: sensor histidine kinase [Chloroflexota bacterium]